jgi:phenolic acid decarboxylase
MSSKLKYATSFVSDPRECKFTIPYRIHSPQGNVTGVFCTDQLLFRVTLKNAVLKTYKLDPGPETCALGVNCSMPHTLDPTKLP